MRFDIWNASLLKAGTLALLGALLVTGCATPQPYDYTAFKQSRPASILVMPPVNNSPDVAATYSLYSLVSMPLAESGYYVFPVGVVDETFHQNGLTNPAEMQEVQAQKLREIFGADAALYINIKQYGTSYGVLSSESRVTAEARLVDLKNGQVLWKGAATASSAEDRNNSNSGGLIGMLVTSVINQIIESSTNKSHEIANRTAYRLLSAGGTHTILYGPRSPKYKTDGVPKP